jgi:glycosyltransferase involved in cell wall biosynthesis
MTISRILHCIPTLESGGAERQLTYLARSLGERGVEIHIALLRGGANLERARASGATIHFLPHRSHHDPALPLRLVRLIDEVKPDAVQTWLPQMDVLGGLAALWRGIPLVVSERSSSQAYPRSWKNTLRRAIGRRGGVVVANSKGGANYWSQLSRAPTVSVVHNIVPIHEIDLVQPDLGEFAADAEMILYVGRYSYEKNLPTLVEALCRVLARRPRGLVLMHGEGPEHGAVTARVQAAGMADRIRVGAFIQSPWALMKSGAAFVSVSDFEGNPNTVLEAAACRCPLILSDIPAHREQFDERSAFLVPARSAQAIADAVEATLTDRVAAARRADAARSVVVACSTNLVADQYLELYRRIVQPQSAVLPSAS